MIVWLLKTLEKNPASVFRKKDLIRKSESQFERLKHLGLLAFCQPDPHHETYPCDHPCANACPMDVVNMEGKLFAICPEDSEVDPIPLAKDDIAGYRLAVDMLIKAIREANNFAGDSYSFSSRMYFIGKHVIKGLSTAFILALFPDAETAEPHLLSLPTRIAANYQRVVVVTPSLGLTQEPIYTKLKAASLFPITLPSSFGQQDLKIGDLAAIGKRLLAGRQCDAVQKTGAVTEDKLISLTEAGILAGVHKGTVSKWADDGQIEHNGVKGRGRKVSKASVLMMKHEREEKQAQGDYEEYRRDIENIPYVH